MSATIDTGEVLTAMESDLIQATGLTKAILLMTERESKEEPEVFSAVQTVAWSLSLTLEAAERKRIILKG